MKPIWYFVGLMLMAIGLILWVTGVYIIIYPPHLRTVLSETHPNIWWGALMMVAGLIFTLANRNKTVE